MFRIMKFGLGLAAALGFAAAAHAQQWGGHQHQQQPQKRYDSSFVLPNGAQVNTPWTFTPQGPVWDPNGFLGHQYINPFGVGNGGIPQFMDTNNQTWPNGFPNP